MGSTCLRVPKAHHFKKAAPGDTSCEANPSILCIISVIHHKCTPYYSHIIISWLQKIWNAAHDSCELLLWLLTVVCKKKRKMLDCIGLDWRVGVRFNYKIIAIYTFQIILSQKSFRVFKNLYIFVSYISVYFSFARQSYIRNHTMKCFHALLMLLWACIIISDNIMLWLALRAVQTIRSFTAVVNAE